MLGKIAIALLAVAAAGLAGCGAARPSKYYQLDVPAAPPAGTNAYPVALLVGRITAPHLFRDDRIVYRAGPGQLGTYEYHRWAEPPTDMLEAMLVRMLRDSGRYGSVQLLRSNARGEYIVRGRLHEMDELSGAPLTARVAFEIELYEIKSGTTVWSRAYSHDEPVGGKDVPAVVAALNRNVQRGMGEVVAGLDAYFAAHQQR
jgi:ABC-type uncharacterized transport system auxiliary subunit